MEDLIAMQNRSLEDKIQTSFAKIMEYMMRCKDKVYVSFSGGKDSTVLADLAARVCVLLDKKLILVFSNTGLEYPEIVQFAKSFPDWLKNKYHIEVEFVMLRPEMSFKQVIDKFGYPVISKEIAERLHYAQKGSEWAIVEMSGKPYYKCSNPEFKKSYKKYQYLIDAPFKVSHRCCEIMKKKPFKKYEKETGNHPMVATMAEESQLRKSQWLKTGCNSFDGKRIMGRPMSFWTEQDVLQYIKECELPYASVYGDIVEENGILRTTKCDRTGCVFCAFGYQLEHKPTRFDKLKTTHPKLYEYCMKDTEDNGLGFRTVLEYIDKNTRKD